MSLLTIYLLTRLSYLSDIFEGLIPLCIAGATVATFFWFMSSDLCDDESPVTKLCAKCMKGCLLVLPIATILHALTPTTKEAFMIIGGYALVNNEEVQKLPANVLGAANGFLEEYIQEAKKEVQDATKAK